METFEKKADARLILSIVAAAQAQPGAELAQSTAQGTHYAFLVLLIMAVAMLCCSAGALRLKRKAH